MHAESRSFHYCDTFTSPVAFAERELTWSPRKGEKTTAVKALADDAMLSVANTLRSHALAGYYQDGWDQ
ncbi:hypothetical protein [Leisingera sp. F5]|uniref:hypothetical protein n=1 Tax=Leisingera sp. F5 TaxID=1813816 RepID=UPI0025BCAFDF|nr:hypothetical protein [Leisingera sp. F5]